MDMLSIIIPRIHPEGPKFIGAFAVATVILLLVWEPLGWIGLILTVWCFYFFRDPDRHTPVGENLVIAPADGIVCSVGEALPPSELSMEGDRFMRVCIFMNVFNCHVNRSPVDGEVDRIVYHPGKFLNASLDKASEDNERNSMILRTNEMGPVAVVQIAGLVARRIVCQVKEDSILAAGERFGIIRFGSRVDVYFRKDIAPLVAVGQTVTGGETVIADMRISGEGRKTEIR